MSQHHEERNLENIPPLLLETIEEDDAKQDVEGEHLLLTNTHSTRIPEESTSGVDILPLERSKNLEGYKGK